MANAHPYLGQVPANVHSFVNRYSPLDLLAKFFRTNYLYSLRLRFLSILFYFSILSLKFSQPSRANES